MATRRTRRTLVAALAALLVTGAFFAGPAAHAAAPSWAGRYIVTLKDGVEAADVAADYHGHSGVAVSHVYDAALNGFAGTFSDGAYGRLVADGRVERVERDGIATVSATTTQAKPPSWGLDRIDQTSLPLSASYSYSYNGAGVRAYIIDTGILTTHKDFGGRAVLGYNAIPDGKTATDCNGHGTHVAGTIGGTTYGVAKGATLVAVRVLGCTGSGAWSDVIAGINWVTNNVTTNKYKAVANMSLGGGLVQSVNDAVTASINAGVVYAVAAGNDNGANACNTSPASTPGALTVGATDKTDARASYSNIGSCLDLFAPGSSIVSDYYSSTTATATMSGTSMATPHVVGAAALRLQAGMTAAAATADIINSATTGKVTNGGTGSPNRLLYDSLTLAAVSPASASLVADFTKTCSGTACSFASSSTGSPTTYSWDLGNGASSSSASASTSYAATGTYAVTLTVGDGTGDTSWVTGNVTCSKVKQGRTTSVRCA